MGQAKQRGTYEQRKALAVALIEENTKVAAIETKRLQAETEPRIIAIANHNASLALAVAAAMAVTNQPKVLHCSPIPRQSSRHKGL